MITMKPCRNPSSHICEIGHDPETNTLAVKFHKGSSVYHYDGVDAGTFDEFHSHESPGSFFHSRIKDQYSGRKA